MAQLIVSVIVLNIEILVAERSDDGHIRIFLAYCNDCSVNLSKIRASSPQLKKDIIIFN